MFSFFSGFVTGILVAIGLLVWLGWHLLSRKETAEWLKGLLKPPPPEERKVP
jgi:hypothetical protein